jgi:glycosyltransferase involved in cell wall biosynthesis
MTDVVIPACNEAATIAGVVRACTGARGVSSVIVVANGCTDDTARKATEAGAFVLYAEVPNKGAAMTEGLRYVDTAGVLFCDGDLSGLTSTHVEGMLVLPPHNGQLCGLTDNPIVGLSRFLPPITGQRRLPTTVARTISLDGSGYEAELRIDAAIGRKRLPHRTVILRGVSNPHRAGVNPWRFTRMAASVLGASVYLSPELLAYEVRGSR